MTRVLTRRGLRLAAVAVVALVPIAACSDDGPAKGEASLEVDGRAVLVRQDGGREEITGRTDVRAGDEIELVAGTGTLDLGDGATLELRGGGGDEAGTKLLMGPVPVLEAGDVLVTTTQELGISVDETQLRVVAGSARASRATGIEVAAYDADVELDSAGQERTIPALREMSVPALGHPPAAARPLEYDAADPWDRRFLGEAIDLGQRLQALADGYTQNLPTATPRTVAFYQQVLPGLAGEADFTPALLASRDTTPGETLVGAAIAELGRRGTFVERWHSVFEFREAGAAWGLVALDQGVDRTPVLGAVSDAVESSPLGIGPNRPGGSSTTVTTVAGSTPTTVPQGTTTTTTPTTPTSLQTPGDPDPGGLLSPIVDPVADLLGGLVNGLLGGLLGG